MRSTPPNIGRAPSCAQVRCDSSRGPLPKSAARFRLLRTGAWHAAHRNLTRISYRFQLRNEHYSWRTSANQTPRLRQSDGGSKMTIKSLVGAAAVAAMGLTSTLQARAAVLTQTEAFGSVVAMPDDHFFLQPFDTSLGTLTGVAITVTLTGTISLEPANLRTSFTYNNASAAASAQLFGPD